VCPATEPRHSKQLERGRVAIGLSGRAGRGRGNEERGSAAARNDFTNRNQFTTPHCRTERGQSQSDCLSSGGVRRRYKTKTGEGLPGERHQGVLGRAIKRCVLANRSPAGSTSFSRDFQQRVSTRAQR